MQIKIGSGMVMGVLKMKICGKMPIKLAQKFENDKENRCNLHTYILFTVYLIKILLGLNEKYCLLLRVRMGIF